MVLPGERDPLLENLNTGSGQAGFSTKNDPGRRLGPLEISRSNRYAILAGVWAATFLSALNATLVATLLSSISSEFEKANQASWLGTSYLLATCTFTPLYGRLSNVMGRRGANQIAVFFAALGTLACGLSQNMPMLIAARFLGGLGGGGIFTTSTIIISDMYSMRSRGLAQGIGAVFNGLGMGLGGPIGGLISDRFGWRWAFLIQVPMFALSFVLTSYNLHYVTPGKGKSAKDVLKRIDYGGTVTLMAAVLSFLFFLSNKFNEEKEWSDPIVIVPLTISGAFSVAFVIVELYVAPEPVLAPFLLQQKIPVLVGLNNFLVATCNFAVMYFFPMWFETVALTNASIAGLHLMPNSLSMSCGSLFAGWMMHRTGKYKLINLIFGIFPFTAAILISQLREDSGPIQMWFSIIPLGFGNAVVLQTTLIALLAHLPQSVMAVGTGFGQLFRGIGQVGGVGIASAIFQSLLDRELGNRIKGPDSAEIIHQIRHSSKLVASLRPDLQRHARDSYAIALRAVFLFAACSTFLAYLVRLPIPEKALDYSETPEPRIAQDADTTQPPDLVHSERDESALSADDEDDQESAVPPLRPRPIFPRRRLSTFESSEGGMDLEDETIGGSARSFTSTRLYIGSPTSR
ncbi:MFS general substrate transporter [Rickenella mellea]|uniref:MFS general substrate transporter n=1 Tax=Rickenella mellea TaxID=50990 RepID=A0A4Y7PU58_9AGAM|nr:MFS general substrate transporter [Rickenella mellea]